MKLIKQNSKFGSSNLYSIHYSKDINLTKPEGEVVFIEKFMFSEFVVRRLMCLKWSKTTYVSKYISLKNQ